MDSKVRDGEYPRVTASRPLNRSFTRGTVIVVDLDGVLGSSPRSESESTRAFFESAEELYTSLVPAVVLEVPTERVVAASPSGTLLLDPDGSSVTGRNFEDFTTDGPSGVLELFASGRVTGYETTRMLRRIGSESLAVSVWMHKFDHQAPSRFALAVFSVPEAGSGGAGPMPTALEPTVVGSTDVSLNIDRVSNDASALFGCSSAELLGQPLTSVVAEEGRAYLLAAVDEAATTNRAVSVHLRAIPRAGESAPGPMCHVVISPMERSPSCAFVLLPVPEDAAGAGTNWPGLAGLLLRLHRSTAAGAIARRLSELGDLDMAGLSQLSTREWEIVTRLLDGDRVPMIASELFLSPSTVRSHLATVFEKMHVGSQQELLDLLQRKRMSGA